MRKLITLLLFVSFHLTSYNQTIKGVVLDKNTKEKICFAAIYFSGTFVGTISDMNGEFVLNIPHITSMPLTISSLGYYSTALTDFTSGEPLIIYLEPKSFDIKEVSVSDISLVKKRKANLELFKEIFLGTTENALNCEIINEQDISFNYETEQDTLKAYVSKPILIKNKGLGYNVTCYLDRFEYYRKSQSFFYKGNFIFNEDLDTEAADKYLYKNKRENAYLGSMMHFFRALWANDLSSAGFIVKNSSDNVLSQQDFVSQESMIVSNTQNSIKKYIRYLTKLKILYHSGTSEIVFSKPKVFFDETGYFDLGLNWEGDMVVKRVGDMLPYDYKINK